MEPAGLRLTQGKTQAPDTNLHTAERRGEGRSRGQCASLLLCSTRVPPPFQTTTNRPVFLTTGCAQAQTDPGSQAQLSWSSWAACQSRASPTVVCHTFPGASTTKAGPHSGLRPKLPLSKFLLLQNTLSGYVWTPGPCPNESQNTCPQTLRRGSSLTLLQAHWASRAFCGCSDPG